MHGGVCENMVKIHLMESSMKYYEKKKQINAYSLFFHPSTLLRIPDSTEHGLENLLMSH